MTLNCFAIVKTVFFIIRQEMTNLAVGALILLISKGRSMMRETYNCCLNCTKRKPKCHDSCKDYLELKEEFAKQKAELKKQNKNSDFAELYERNRIKAIKKRRRLKR